MKKLGGGGVCLTEIYLSIRLICTENTYFLQAMCAVFPSTWQDIIALIPSAHRAAVPAHPHAAEGPRGRREGKATATFISCQPDACWLLAKPAAPAQRQPQLTPGVKQGFPFQR